MTGPSQWELIFQNDGYVFPEPRPQVVKFTEQLIARKLSSVLDLGCGNGRHLLYMAKKGLRLTGMDNAPTALQLTRRWLDQEGMDASLVLTDMRVSLPFASVSFDVVLSTQVIHHALLATVIGTAREIDRIIRPGGMILISVPARRAIMEDASAHNMIEPNTFIPADGPEKGLPHHLFTPEEFRQIFPGFQVLDLQVFDDRVIVLQAIKQ